MRPNFNIEQSDRLLQWITTVCLLSLLLCNKFSRQVMYGLVKARTNTAFLTRCFLFSNYCHRASFHVYIMHMYLFPELRLVNKLLISQKYVLNLVCTCTCACVKLWHVHVFMIIKLKHFNIIITFIVSMSLPWVCIIQLIQVPNIWPFTGLLNDSNMSGKKLILSLIFSWQANYQNR